MKIDVFTHIMPPAYVKRVLPGTSKATQAFAKTTPTLSDLAVRFELMDRFPDVAQVLTLAGPVEPAGKLTSADVARITNDGLAELVALYPERFAGAVASLPLDDIDAALAEAERALGGLGLQGVEVFTPCHGKPLDDRGLFSLYKMMVEADLPIWIHPRRELKPDYDTEERSRYRVFGMWGWPYETTVAMTRLVFGGVLERFPGLKFITHHCGGMVPYFEQRIVTWYEYMEGRLGARYTESLSRPLLDYFRMFYNDTAVNGSTPALQCGVSFFGADRVLFGTDMPFDNELGAASIRETTRSVEELDVSAVDREKIFAGNARRLLRLGE